MIAQKGRESKRGKTLKMARNIERLFKEGKCRECSVVVTRMDFAKILGKFTKVKIQYESSSPKLQKKTETTTTKANGRLKNNENGMVQSHKNKQKQVTVKDIQKVTKPKNKEVPVPKRQTNNILKENNVLKKVASPKNKEVNLRTKIVNSSLKHYAIIFNDPTNNNNNEFKSEIWLKDLLPNVDKSVLPSPDWYADFFPKLEEPKNDKVYDRIAAELEDLMRSEPSQITTQDEQPPENKPDEFPSIMDILNDNSNISNMEQRDQNAPIEYKGNLDSSDVEAMLLGKSENPKTSESNLMEVDNADVTKLIENVVSDSTNESEDIKNSVDIIPEANNSNEVDNPSSPSILEDTSKKVEDNLTLDSHEEKENTSETCSVVVSVESAQTDKNEDIMCNNLNVEDVKVRNTDLNNMLEQKREQNSLFQIPMSKLDGIMYVTFKKIIDGKCSKLVTCPKNLKYTIELDQKSVEFLGAPKYISTLDDLQVLLQIVNESELNSPYVLY